MVGNLDQAEKDKMRMLKDISGEKNISLALQKISNLYKRQVPKTQKCFLRFLI